MKTYLCFDASNVIQRTFMAGWTASGNKEETIGLALHSAIVTINKYFNKFNPDKVFCVFDRPNWRKIYTQSELCLSQQIYKGNRRKNFTPTEQLRYEEFIEHIGLFESILKEHTSIVTMSCNHLEADDILAGIAEQYQDDRVIIISADKDFMQLLKFENLLLIDPMTDRPRVCDDIEWFMFLKCIRGDRGDWVRSAFPRVRETRVRNAFNDELERLNLMNEEWTDQNKNTNTVGDLFEENKLLMDLFSQPQYVKDLIHSTINDAVNDPGKYNHFRFVKFCNKHKLINIRNRITEYAKMLSS